MLQAVSDYSNSVSKNIVPFRQKEEKKNRLSNTVTNTENKPIN